MLFHNFIFANVLAVAVSSFAFVLHFETERFTLTTSIDMETNVTTPTNPQHDAKLPVSKSLAPHQCPVCNGNGLVPNGFYMQTSGYWSTSSITPETCRSCSGTGIVWG